MPLYWYTMFMRCVRVVPMVVSMSRGTKDLIRGTTAARIEPQPPAGGNTASGRPRSDSDGSSSSPAPVAAGGGGGTDLVAQLKSKLDAQRRELDERTDNVNAIQRNFQRLSEMYSGDRGRIGELEAELAHYKAELESLRAEKKVHAALRAEYAALQKEVATERSDRQGAQAAQTEELGKLRSANATLKEELQLLRATVEAAARKQERDVVGRQHLQHSSRSLGVAANAVFEQLADIQRVVGLAPPAVGAGLTKIDVNSAGLSSDDLVEVVARALQFSASGSFDGIHRAVSESAAAHASAIAALEAAAAGEKRAREDAALAEQSSIAELQRSLAEANTKLKELSKLFNLERQTLHGKAQNSEAAAAQRGAELAAELAEARAARDVAERRAREQEQQLAALRDELTQLRQELQQHRAAADDSARQHGDASSAMAAQMGDAQRRLQQAEEALAAAQVDCTKLRGIVDEKTALVASLTRDLDEARGRYEKLKRELAQRTEADATARKLEETIERLETQLKDERLAHEAAVQALNRQLADAKADTVAAERHADALQHALALKSNENLELGLRLEDRDAQLRAARNELEAAQRVAGRATDDNSAAMKRTAEELREKVTSLEADNRALKETIRALTDDARKATEAEQRASALHAAAVAESAALARDLAQVRTAAAQAKDGQAAAEARCEAAQRRASAADVDAREARLLVERTAREQGESSARARELADRIQRVSEWAGEVKALQRESIKAVKKVLAAEEACESGYSCQSCLEVMKDPVVCAPCGHAFCRACYTTANKASGGGKGLAYCPECEEHFVTHVMPSKHLELLAGKFEFRKRALRELAGMLDKTFASLEANTEKA
jgi:chromosome segregation ATPase